MTVLAHVHRFRDLVAVSVGDGSTTYLTEKEAKLLSRHLRKVARSIKIESFQASNLPNFTILRKEP